MGIGIIGASSGATEALPSGAKSKIATITCGGVKEYGTLAAGKYIVQSTGDAVVYLNNWRPIGRLQAGVASEITVPKTGTVGFVLTNPRANVVARVEVSAGLWNRPGIESPVMSRWSSNRQRAVIRTTNSGVTHITKDGGTTWKTLSDNNGLINFPNAQNDVYLGATITPNGDIYIAGAYNTATQLARSTDGGDSFTLQTLSTSDSNYSSYNYPIGVTNVGERWFVLQATSSTDSHSRVVYGTGSTEEGSFTINWSQALGNSYTSKWAFALYNVPGSTEVRVYRYGNSSYQFRYYSFNGTNPPSAGIYSYTSTETNARNSSSAYSAWKDNGLLVHGGFGQPSDYYYGILQLWMKQNNNTSAMSVTLGENPSYSYATERTWNPVQDSASSYLVDGGMYTPVWVSMPCQTGRRFHYQSGNSTFNYKQNILFGFRDETSNSMEAAIYPADSSDKNYVGSDWALLPDGRWFATGYITNNEVVTIYEKA